MANTTTAGPSLPGLTPELQELIRSTALELGIDPVDLAMAMNYETIQTFDPDKWGGTGGNYLGLIQFGPQEQHDFGVYPGMPLGDQVAAAGRFLRQRGVEPGMGILDIYSAINAGSVGLYDRSDRIDLNTGRPVTVADHVAFNIEPTRESIAAAMLTPEELAEAELQWQHIASLQPEGLATNEHPPVANFYAVAAAQQALIDEGAAPFLEADGVWTPEWSWIRDSRDAVRTGDLQQYLVDGGFLPPTDARGFSMIDGGFGPVTAAALAAARAAELMPGYFEPGFNYDPALMEPHGFHPATTPYYYDYGTPVTTIAVHRDPSTFDPTAAPFGTYLNAGPLPPWAYDPTPSVATVPLSFLPPPPPLPHPNPTRLATPVMPATVPLPRPRPDPFVNPAYPSLTGRARVLW